MTDHRTAQAVRWRVRHATRYGYAAAVDLGTHLLHLTPRSLPSQHVRTASLTISPEPARRRDGHDHFGNPCTWLTLDRPHTVFEAVAEAEVELHPRAGLTTGRDPPWDVVAAMARAGSGEAWRASEFLPGSPLAPAEPGAGAYAALSFPAGRGLGEALLDLTRRIHQEFAFRAGVTDIATPVAQTLMRRVGVCQDFAHLMVAALRALGLPARYVSGYIRTHPAAGSVRLRGADQSHAWVGAWLGPEAGWIDFDPTNGVIVRQEHVVLGWGRDFGDVSPVRGVVLGGGQHTLEVAVDMEPAAATQPARTA